LELKKRKYKRKEVSAIILALHKNYQEKLSECKEKIIELARENTEIKTQLDAYLSKENLISSTLINVEKNFQDMREQAQLNYKLELDRLKRFSQKWDEYFSMPTFGTSDL
jgi:predicted nuclease with TOPRIM domain